MPLIRGSGLRDLLLLVPQQQPPDVAKTEETTVEEEADEQHVPNPSWEPWQWKRYEWEKSGKIGGTAAVLVQPHCRKVDNVGSVFCVGSVCVCLCMAIANGTMVDASTLFNVFPKLTSEGGCLEEGAARRPSCFEEIDTFAAAAEVCV